MKPGPITANQVRITVVLAIFFICLARFMIFLTGIVAQDLQLDFVSLYAAGVDLNHGKDPYVNHVLESPDLWDGFNPLQNSRFLYPPLAGSIFQPLGLLSYDTAKQIWSVFIIVCVIFSIALQADVLKYQFSRKTWMLIGAAGLLFFPLMAELERGQIDALCLLLLSLSLYFSLRERPRQIMAGLFLAMASLFKLHSGLMLFYILVKRQYKTAAGFALGWILIALISVSFYGLPLQKKYITVEMPRISKYICYGNETMRINPLILGVFSHDIKLEHVKFQGTDYAIESLNLTATGGVPYYIKILFQSKYTFGTWALLTAAFMLSLVLWQEIDVRTSPNYRDALLANYIFWQIGFVAILLSGPITWVMNSVWLISLVPFCFYYYPLIKSRHDAIGWCLVLLGLIVSGYPDESGGLHEIDISYVFYIFKPIVGEILCFVGLLRMYRIACLGADSDPGPETDKGTLSGA